MEDRRHRRQLSSGADSIVPNNNTDTDFLDKTANMESNSILLFPRSSIRKFTRRRRLRKQCLATLLMCVVMPLPLAIYSPMAAIQNYVGGARPIDVCTLVNRSAFSDLFEPSFLVGNFTLGQAKAIDLVWNTVVGRGVQFLMAWSSFSILTQGLMRIAEGTPVQHDLFAAVVFKPIAYPLSCRCLGCPLLQDGGQSLPWAGFCTRWF
jgi:hypothetical protein